MPEYNIMTTFEFINGKKFKELAVPGNPYLEYYDTHDYWNILKYIIRARKDKENIYKLITHNSDWAVSKCLENMGVIPKELPFNLKWFTQNVDVEHPNIISIPIGLENPHWHTKIQKTEKISYCMKYRPKYNLEMCVAQFNPDTNPRRRAIFDHFSQFDWCLSTESVNGSKFDDYLTNLNDCVFCVCPEGNGIDTHRMWEALYVGCIPIVEDSINIQFYRKLPIFICHNLLDINYDSLKYVKQSINDRLYEDYNMTMLSMDYWKAKIYDLT